MLYQYRPDVGDADSKTEFDKFKFKINLNFIKFC